MDNCIPYMTCPSLTLPYKSIIMLSLQVNCFAVFLNQEYLEFHIMVEQQGDAAPSVSALQKDIVNDVFDFSFVLICNLLFAIFFLRVIIYVLPTFFLYYIGGLGSSFELGFWKGLGACGVGLLGFLGLRLFNTCNRITLGIKLCLLFSFSIKPANQSLLVIIIFSLFSKE